MSPDPLPLILNDIRYAPNHEDASFEVFETVERPLPVAIRIGTIVPSSPAILKPSGIFKVNEKIKPDATDLHSLSSFLKGSRWVPERLAGLVWTQTSWLLVCKEDMCRTDIEGGDPQDRWNLGINSKAHC